MDQRLDRRDAESLIRRRIDRSSLRFRKQIFGVPAAEPLASHFALVTLLKSVTLAGRPVQVLQWGVTVNGLPAGYLALTHGGTRHKFLPSGFGRGAVEISPPRREMTSGLARGRQADLSRPATGREPDTGAKPTAW